MISFNSLFEIYEKCQKIKIFKNNNSSLNYDKNQYLLLLLSSS
jgi:hypothetical protein